MKFVEKAKEISEKTFVDLPSKKFIYGIIKCWKCRNPILVFSWENYKDLKSLEDDDSKPHTIKLIKTFSGEESWGNTCPYCERMQGNHYLYDEPDGPFWAINSKHKESEWGADMEKVIANCYDIY